MSALDFMTNYYQLFKGEFASEEYSLGTILHVKHVIFFLSNKN
jgi:hypothetical protein